MQINVTEVDLTSVIGEKRTYDEDGDYLRTEPMTLGDAVAERIVQALLRTEDFRSIAREAVDIRQDEIRERTRAEVEAALTGPVDLTNHYGERTGRTTTLREEVVRLASEALKVDHRASHARDLTPVQRIIRDEVDRALTNELKAAVDDEKAKVVAAVRAKAADLIATAVKEGVGR